MTRASRKNRKRHDKATAAPAVSLAQVPWDLGATGKANRCGLVIEDGGDIDPETGKRINPNSIKRARRVDMLEVWHRKGDISATGYNAAVKLRDAFEATARAPGWPDNDRVQSSPKPDHAVAIQIDRMSRFHAYHQHVSADDREIIDACVLRSGTPASLKRYRGPGYRDGMAHLHDALERLARAIC